MKKISFIICAILMAAILNGCAISPPFNNRVDYLELKKMRKIDNSIDDLKIIWIPVDFPSSIEVKGSSGFRGSAAQVRIPTGISISSRLIEALDQVLTVEEESKNILRINVIKAESNFTFIAGLFSSESAIDWGEVIFEAEFSFNEKKWKDTFHFEKNDERLDGSSLTRPLETAWDKTATAMASSIIKHINYNGN